MKFGTPVKQSQPFNRDYWGQLTIDAGFVSSQKPHNWGTKIHTSTLRKFVHLDKKFSNQSIYRQLNLAFYTRLQGFYVRIRPRTFNILINKFINHIPVNMFQSAIDSIQKRKTKSTWPCTTVIVETETGTPSISEPSRCYRLAHDLIFLVSYFKRGLIKHHVSGKENKKVHVFKYLASTFFLFVKKDFGCSLKYAELYFEKWRCISKLGRNW